MITELIIFSITIIIVIVFFHRKPEGLPPGEWGLPVVGYLPFMHKKITKTFAKLQKKHGKIFSIKLGSTVFIVIGDYPLIKETFNKPEVSGRPYVYTYDAIKGSPTLGIVLSSGHVWTTNRRFALKTLRDYGLGKSRLEEYALSEAEFLVKEMKHKVDKPSSIDFDLNVAILNVIWRLVADRRYSINDEGMQITAKYVQELIELSEGPMAIFDFFPWLFRWLPNIVLNSWMKVDVLLKKRETVYNHISDIIEDHRKTLNEDHPRDLIDQYLIEQAQQKDNPEYAHCGEADLLALVTDFFMAGSETTSSTLRWFFLCMIKYPAIQKRIQQEIDNVLLRDKLPSLEDKERLPCLQALSYEIGRFATIFPNGLAHEVMEDIMLEGYTIPKGSVVVYNGECIHKDPKYWDHPNEFSLENFLDRNGKFVLKKDGYLPFSIGRRQCLGEATAKLELFVFMGAILQTFDILEPEGQNASLIPDETVNLFNYPQKYNVILKIRE